MPETEKIAIDGMRIRLIRLWSVRPWNPNPLLRMSDRVEAAVRIVAVLAVLIAVPAAGAFGTATYAESSARIRAENAVKSSVGAVITDQPRQMSPQRTEATVRWDEYGRAGVAVVLVPHDAAPGDRITVWLEPGGTPTTGPRDGSAAAMAGVGAGFVVLAGTWVCGWCLVMGAGWLLDRRRGVGWDRDWRQLSRPIREDRQ